MKSVGNLAADEKGFTGNHEPGNSFATEHPCAELFLDRYRFVFPFH
jgi:hypothetical protein